MLYRSTCRSVFYAEKDLIEFSFFANDRARATERIGISEGADSVNKALKFQTDQLYAETRVRGFPGQLTS